MGATGTALATPTLLAAVEWDQPSRQQLARSHAFELLGNQAPDEEISAAITDEVRALLPAAIAGLDREARRPLSEGEIAALMKELGRYIAITGTSMGGDERQEWISFAAAELAALPMSLVMPAVAAARRREPWPNKLVAAVFNLAEEKAARLDAEADKLRRLAELA